MSDRERIAIIGAGLGGSLLACYLARLGYEVSVFERRGDPRTHGFLGGRSINLALSARGIAALEEIGLAQTVLRSVIPMPGRIIHDPDGDLHYQAYSKNPGDRINSVSRADLNITLLNAAAEHPNVTFFFDHRCVAIDFERPCMTFEVGSSPERIVCDTDRIIGTDGAYSAVRLQMMLGMDRFEYHQSFLEHGYKELTIPAVVACGFASDDPRRDKFDGFAMNPNALHIWPRGELMMIALPNQDRSFTCTCFWPNAVFAQLKEPTEIEGYFKRHFRDALPLMPKLVEDFRRNPVGSLVTIHCSPWHHQDRAMIIGDAAHAIVPFYGQGANCAFEDCRVLAACIKQHAPDWGRAFAECARLRKPNADAIAEMALHNFVEMRDKTASPLFRARKKLEHALHAIMPGWFTPLYNMISFSTIPYAEAQARARRQSAVMATVLGILAFIFLAMLIAIMV